MISPQFILHAVLVGWWTIFSLCILYTVHGSPVDTILLGIPTVAKMKESSQL